MTTKKRNGLELIQIFTEEEDWAHRTRIARMTWQEGVESMKKRGFKCEKSKYYELLASHDAKQKDRNRYMLEHGFEDQHIKRMDETETIIGNLWIEYKEEKNHLNRARILKIIGEFQPLAAAVTEEFVVAHDKQEELAAKQKARDANDTKPKEKKPKKDK